MPSPRFDPHPDGSIHLWIKAVPGASRDQIAGVLGDRLKIRVSAPPEAGKANAAICETLAAALKIKPRQIEIHAGHVHPEKIVRITGVDAEQFAKFIEQFKE